jgi:hypothetical protein
MLNRHQWRFLRFTYCYEFPQIAVIDRLLNQQYNPKYLENHLEFRRLKEFSILALLP